MLFMECLTLGQLADRLAVEYRAGFIVDGSVCPLCFRPMTRESKVIAQWMGEGGKEAAAAGCPPDKCWHHECARGIKGISR